MTTKTNFVMFFAIATILLASPLATGSAYADKVDKIDKSEAKGLKEWEKAEKKIAKEEKKVAKAEAKAAIELTRSEAAQAAAIVAFNVENNAGEDIEILQAALTDALAAQVLADQALTDAQAIRCSSKVLADQAIN